MNKNAQTYYLPCDEHDENCSGGYTSYDGRSLCHVSEQQGVVLSVEEYQELLDKIESLKKLIIHAHSDGYGRGLSAYGWNDAWKVFKQNNKQALSQLNKE